MYRYRAGALNTLDGVTVRYTAPDTDVCISGVSYRGLRFVESWIEGYSPVVVEHTTAFYEKLVKALVLIVCLCEYSRQQPGEHSYVDKTRMAGIAESRLKQERKNWRKDYPVVSSICT